MKFRSTGKKRVSRFDAPPEGDRGQNTTYPEPSEGHQDESKAGAFRKGPDGVLRGYDDADNQPEDSKDTAEIDEPMAIGQFIARLRESKTLGENNSTSNNR